MNKLVFTLTTVFFTVILGSFLFLPPSSPESPASSSETPTINYPSPEPLAPVPDESVVMGETTPEISLTISNFAYSPPTLVVQPGTIIKLTNMDSAEHNVASDDNLFSTELLAKGQSTTFTAPLEPGTYPYHCTPHPYMQATLIVE